MFLRQILERWKGTAVQTILVLKALLWSSVLSSYMLMQQILMLQVTSHFATNSVYCIHL